jgi:hypothetical protein
MGRIKKKSFNFTSKVMGEKIELHETCQRPDIYLNNYRFCNGCPNTITCKCHLKQFIQDELPVKRKERL